jgi:transposase
VDAPEVWLDNNATERGIRRPVIGRRNHFGSKPARGPQMAAILYSLGETATVPAVDPIAHLVAAATRAKRESTLLLTADFGAAA